MEKPFCKLAVVILLACMFFTFFTSSNSAIPEIVEAAETTPQLILETDKSVYSLGENITILLKNVGDERVKIGG